MKPFRVGILAFPGVMALDVVGPHDAFRSAFVDGRHAYDVTLIGLTRGALVAESGITFKPDRTVAERLDLDTLIIPGGAGLRQPRTTARVAAWIAARAPKIRRIASVCTGIYGLAPTGLLDGRRVTTHWRFARAVAEKFPALNVDAKALYVRDGKFYTSAGVTAGIDLALALIEHDLGSSAALAVARELVVYLKRSGGQEQYSEPLQLQVESTDRISELAVWMGGHLRHDLSVEVLAGRACLCPRQFTRRFTRVFGRTPGAFVEDLRLAAAQTRLAAAGSTVDGVAQSVGFRSADAFRRAFERRFGITPTAYRRRFARGGGA